MLEYLPGVVCIMLVGHIDSPKTKEYVAAATLSTMVPTLPAYIPTTTIQLTRLCMCHLV